MQEQENLGHYIRLKYRIVFGANYRPQILLDQQPMPSDVAASIQNSKYPLQQSSLKILLLLAIIRMSYPAGFPC